MIVNVQMQPSFLQMLFNLNPIFLSPLTIPNDSLQWCSARTKSNEKKGLSQKYPQDFHTLENGVSLVASTSKLI